MCGGRNIVLSPQGPVVCQVKLSNGLMVHGPQCQSENDAKEKAAFFALQRLVQHTHAHTRTHTVYKSQPVLLFSCKTEASLPVSFCSSIELSGIRLPPPSCTIPRSRSDTTPTHRSLQPTRSVIHTYSLVSYSVTEVESFYRCTCLQEFNCLQKLPTHLLAASLCFLSLLHLTCHVPLCLDEKPYKWIN